MTSDSTATSARPGHGPRPAPARSRGGRPAGPDQGTPGERIPSARVRIGSPTSLLAVIPGLLGFDPGRSIVIIGVDPRSARVRLTLRYDVPDPGRPRDADALARQATDLLRAQDVQTAVAAGYGPAEVISPVAAALRERAAAAGIAMTELLRADEGRYWSYVCADPGCCPPAGTPYDITGHPAARALLAAGGRVLASREALAATVVAVGGQQGAALRRAGRRFRAEVTHCAARLNRAGLGAPSPGLTESRLTAFIGQEVVADAIDRYRAGGRVPDDHAAALTVVLTELRVRDDAWARMEPDHRHAHLRLWTDLTRLARPGCVAAPASLLAFVAWQDGNGALANVALDRALADSPRYSLALLLRSALDSGAPPAMARLPMTPEEVEAAYDTADAAQDAAGATVPAGEVGRK